MHTFSENSSGVPAFLAKLWRLVEDEETNNLIYWSAVSVAFSLYIQNIWQIPVYFSYGKTNHKHYKMNPKRETETESTKKKSIKTMKQKFEKSMAFERK